MVAISPASMRGFIFGDNAMRRFKPRGIDALYGISAEIIAELCGIHITTARRWKRGEEPTFAALQLIKLFTTGDLVVVDPKWNGWRIRHGLLIAADGMRLHTR